MIYVSLHFPVILRKQLPEIAKQMDVPEKELKDLLVNRSFYAVKDGKPGVYAMPENLEGISVFFSGFQLPRFGSEAVIEYAKTKGVEVLFIKEITKKARCFCRIRSISLLCLLRLYSSFFLVSIQTSPFDLPAERAFYS